VFRVFLLWYFVFLFKLIESLRFLHRYRLCLGSFKRWWIPYFLSRSLYIYMYCFFFNTLCYFWLFFSLRHFDLSYVVFFVILAIKVLQNFQCSTSVLL
jgi:hypothetical protein